MVIARNAGERALMNHGASGLMTALDGIAWDEPACEVGWESYRWGAASAEAFARING